MCTQRHFVKKLSVLVFAGLITVALSAPAFAAADSQAEIAALKAEIHKLAAKVDDLEKQQIARSNTVVTTLSQGASAAAGPHNWSGPYVGANVGAGITSGAVEQDLGGGNDNFSNGFVQGGLHAGYNYQRKHTVLGVEAEANFGNQNHKAQTNDPMFMKSQIDWSVALLGRAGIAMDDTLFFVDAGPALAHLRGSALSNGFVWKADEWEPGIKGGVGVEFMLTPDISLRAQYSMLAIASKAYQAPGCGPPFCEVVWTNMQQAATIGADWHF